MKCRDLAIFHIYLFSLKFQLRNKNNRLDVSIYVTFFISLQSKQETEWN